MFKKKPLASAISSISIASALAATGIAAPSYAQDSTDVLEEVVITGSRIRRAVGDAPRPMTVIDREDIELSGLENIADVLRGSAYNSFGSFRERSGSSFGQIALVDLRGLGADRTAVLVNGRRIPGNPLTGTTAVDINSIPQSAIARTEILTDSASSVYGADAIGGVVNIVMRDDFEGAEFEIGGDAPSRKGADSDYFNFTFGSKGDQSNIVFSGEWFRRDPVFDADRDYSRVTVTPGPGGGLPRHGIDTVGVSSGGNTGFNQDFDEAFLVSPTCDPSLYVPIADPEGIPNSEGCGFGYADLSMLTGGIDRQSTYLNANYQISDDHKIYMENRYSRLETFGRYAPAVGFFQVGADNPFNPRGDAVRGAGNGEDIFLFHRFVGHGNRDDSVQTNELDSTIGFRGTIGGVDINYDAHARYYQYVAQEEGDTYVLTSIIEALVASGDYDFSNPLSQDPTHLAAIGQSSATLFRDISTEAILYGVSFDGSFGDLPGGTIGWAAGIEGSSEEYEDQYDSFREAGNVLGSAGNSSAGGRSHKALYGEAELPVIDSLTFNISGRYDDYDDFGNETSLSVAAAYEPLDILKFRASYGEGFKAPNLTSVHSQLSQSFDRGQDFTSCRAQGIADADCPATQYENYTGGNQDLLPETAESLNFGVIVDPLDNLSLSLDWWSVDIEDSIQSLSVQRVFDLEAAGQSLPPGVIINRGATGSVTSCAGGNSPPNCGLIIPFANIATEEVAGVDVRAQYNIDTDSLGSFTTILELSRYLKYDFQPLAGERVEDLVEEDEGFPEFRSNLTVRWHKDDWSVNYIYHLIDGHSDRPATSGTVNSRYGKWNSMDLNVTYFTPWGGEVSFGALNLTDEDPEPSSVGSYNADITLFLYDVNGRTPYFKYKHNF